MSNFWCLESLDLASCACILQTTTYDFALDAVNILLRSFLCGEDDFWQEKLVFSQVRCSPVPTCTGCSRTAPSTSCRRRSVGRNTSDSYNPHLVPSRSNAKRARQLFVAYFRVARIKVTLQFFSSLFQPFNTDPKCPANIFAVQVRKRLFFYLTLTPKILTSHTLHKSLHNLLVYDSLGFF